MSIRKLISVAALSVCMAITALPSMNAQQLDSLIADPDFDVEKLSDAEIDGIDVNRKLKINDYSMIGVQYGVNMSQVYWTPSYQQRLKFLPYNFGIVFTRYGKMFGYMPYFGFQVGVFYGQEGYSFKNEVKSGEEKKHYTTYLNSKSAVLNVVEVPVLAHFHIDFWKMKMMLNVGFFGGYRLSIDREEDTDEYNSSGGFNPDYAHSFASFEKRLDYGLKGGAGFAFMFDPVEIHFTATYKHSFSSLCHPDYYSQYYYRYAYPMNITVSVGLHFQLTKRTGRSKHELRKEARNIVFGPEKKPEPASAAETEEDKSESVSETASETPIETVSGNSLMDAGATDIDATDVTDSSDAAAEEPDVKIENDEIKENTDR